ncbi:uncharacterized protein LOC132366073 isoform X1 [Balaenoptera ricei]|uniref:uncharacterized protein LOC132366073 isoform X1 n=1 Tax=Balaenoptera ricei TaxID=2746895 RepID=UPI0028BF57D9|nr:uncharacterized protein LOC132366073 isoform X1 [Balaenoptera ricei]XP_059779398.1 uncharacterized protein LOC132366073 isoform X1 [Balaenoptera ricei]
MSKHFSTAFPAFPQKPKPPHKQKTTLCFIKKITQLQVPMLPGSPLKNGSEKSPVLRASIIKLCYDMKGLGSSTLDENYFVQSLVPSAGSSSAFDAVWDLPLIQVFHWAPSTPFSLNGTPCSLHTPMPLGCSMAPCPSPQRYNLSHLSGPLKDALSLKSSLNIPSGSVSCHICFPTACCVFLFLEIPITFYLLSFCVPELSGYGLWVRQPRF